MTNVNFFEIIWPDNHSSKAPLTIILEDLLDHHNDTFVLVFYTF